MKSNSQRPLDSSLPIKERMQALLADLAHDSEDPSFATRTLHGVEFLSACRKTHSARYAFTVEPFFCNKSGNLHGGVASTFFDNLTTLALLTIAKPGYWDTFGVSRNLTMMFLRPIPVGIKVFVDCEVVAAGKRMVNIKSTMKTADGKVCAICLHEKAALERPKL
jgi:acyl-coenzyme A thioesterase 13